MPNERKNLNIKYEIKGIEDSKEDNIKVIKGLGNVYDVVDAYGDVTRKGAFDETVKLKPEVPCLFEHRENMGLCKLSLEQNGLGTEMHVNLDTPKGKEAYALAKQYQKSGRPMEMSIGYIAKKSEYDEEHDLRYLTLVEVWEVSLVTWGANSSSKVESVKSTDPNKTNYTDLQKDVLSILNQKSKKVFDNFIETGKIEDISLKEYINLKIKEKSKNGSLTYTEVEKELSEKSVNVSNLLKDNLEPSKEEKEILIKSLKVDIKAFDIFEKVSSLEQRKKEILKNL